MATMQRWISRVGGWWHDAKAGVPGWWPADWAAGEPRAPGERMEVVDAWARQRVLANGRSGGRWRGHWHGKGWQCLAVVGGGISPEGKKMRGGGCFSDGAEALMEEVLRLATRGTGGRGGIPREGGQGARSSGRRAGGAGLVVVDGGGKLAGDEEEGGGVWGLVGEDGGKVVRG